MTQTPLAIAIGSMHFSLKWHGIVKDMPGGVRWYAAWSVTETQILGQTPSIAPYAKLLLLLLLPNSMTQCAFVFAFASVRVGHAVTLCCMYKHCIRHFSKRCNHFLGDLL